MANANRKVADITTFGPAPISFARNLNTRTTDFNDLYWEFGYKQTWQHNWNYELRRLGTVNRPHLLLRYANGNEYEFYPPGYFDDPPGHAIPATVGMQFTPSADNGDRLYVTGLASGGAISACMLLTAKGEELDFQRSTDPAFHLIEKRDGLGNSWICSYDRNDKFGHLILITNNFGRWIQIEGITDSNHFRRITQVSTSDERSVSYSYGQWANSGKVVLTGTNYPGGEHANYTYVTADPNDSTARPVLEVAIDPNYGAGLSGAQIKWLYNYDAIFDFGHGPFLVTGTVLEQRNADTEQTIVRLPLGAGWYPKVVEGDSTEITRQYTNALLTTKGDGFGRITTLTRDSNGFGFVNSETEPNYAVTYYENDYAGRVLTRTDANGGTRQNTYNDQGFLLTHEDELHHLSTWHRESVISGVRNSRVTRKDYPDGTYEEWPLYNANSQALTHRLRNGGTEHFIYDSLGNKTSRTDAMGNVTSYTYWPNGLVHTVTDANQHTTTYSYNWRGQVLTITHPDSTAITYVYDDFGNRTSVTDELSHVATYTYDEYNRVKTVTNPLNGMTTYEYGRSPGCNTCSYVGTISRVTSPSGRMVTYDYDASGLRTCKTVGADSPDAATTFYAYDDAKNMTSMTDPLERVWHYGYDAEHRRTSRTDPLGNETQWTYDEHGNKLTETRPDGGVTYFVYDERNRLAQTTDPAGHVTQMTYTDADRLLTLQDPRENVYTFSYDALNRKTSLTYPDSSAESFGYDPVGNQTSYTTRAGQVKTSTFDNRDRETHFGWSDSTPAVDTTYDSVGRVLTMNSNVSSLSYGYDVAGQLLHETQTIAGGPGAKTVNYTYDLDGNRLTLGYPDSQVATYAYNGRNRLASISLDSASPLVTYEYDAADNRLSKVLENGTATTYTYDNANRLLSIEHHVVDGRPFASFQYGYNNVSNRTFVQREDELGDAFAYDEIDQLTGVRYNMSDASSSGGGGGLGEIIGGIGGGGLNESKDSFEYDPAGNRTAVNGQNYEANNLNEYLSRGSDSFSYDTNGNLTYNSADHWTNTYDAQNRLISAVRGNESMTIAYDARNRPVKRAVAPGVLPVSAVSRKTHGGAGNFDISLPLTGTAGVECRSGGASGEHTIVVSFSGAITFAGTTVTSGTGSIASTESNGTDVTIHLTGVSNAQTIKVSLNGVTDGTLINNVVIGMGVLLGDVTGNGFVNSTDVSTVQFELGHAITTGNYRSDVTANGLINNLDVSTVQAQSSTALPSSPALSQTPPSTYLIYDAWNLIAEHDVNGNQIAKYVHAAKIDELLQRVAGSTALYYHHDALGSTARLTDNAGAVVEQYSYSAFGATTIKDDSGAHIASSAYGNRFLYTGREHLGTDELYDYRNRVYSADLGRFLQTDPQRFDARDSNLYRYVFNNPGNRKDPLGLYCEWHEEKGGFWQFEPDYEYPTPTEDALNCRGPCEEFVREVVSYNAHAHCGWCDEYGVEHSSEACVQGQLGQYEALLNVFGCESLP